MIKVIFNTKSDTIHFTGHSEKDICASVSTIMYTTLNLLTKYNESCFEFEDNRSLDYCVVTILKRDNIIDMIIDNMYDMLHSLIVDNNISSVSLNKI